MAKHKHADLIKAWADGAKIQMKRNDGSWVELYPPRWDTTVEYRIKPEPELSLPYRLCLWRGIDGVASVCVVRCAAVQSDRAMAEATWEGMPEFIRWISHWRQEEV